jgi:DNA (cytosine-5)-methyltransferase 1
MTGVSSTFHIDSDAGARDLTSVDGVARDNRPLGHSRYMLLMPPKLVSLFAGAGGFDAGLERAGFETVLTLDNAADAVQTLKATKAARIPIGDGRSFLASAHVEEADLTGVSRGQLLELYGRPPGTLDLLAGGPPCQSFSSAGRMRSLHDARGRLFEEFVRAAAVLSPKVILFENVQGLVTARDADGEVGGVLRLVQEAFGRIGYAMSWALVNAADFGSPQRRVRLVGIGSRRYALPTMPPPSTHAKPSDQASLLLPPWVTLRDALRGLPTPAEDQVVRPKPEFEERLKEVAAGSGIRVGGAVEANRPGGHWGYRQDGFVADWDTPSRTVRAASTPDWLRLPDGSHRRLTWLECARLQGFPDDWCFVGSATSRFRQIGNAVPAQLAEAMGRLVLEVLIGGELPRNAKAVSPEWPKSFNRRIRYTNAEERVNGADRRSRSRAVA